jgi:hypothetical protein
MRLQLFKTLWGHSGTIEEAVALCREAGFDGIEGPVPLDPAERRAFVATLAEAGMPLIAEVCTATTPGLYVPRPGASPGEHLGSLRAGIERSLEAAPLFVNTLAGSDAWSFSEQVDFHAALVEMENEYDLAISVETHRGRPLNSAWATAAILREVPGLKLTCDFSHFVVVAERLVLDEEPAILQLCADHAWHLQTRVGYDQGPQVPDPRAPEYAEALAAHERWWDRVWESQEARGFERSTLTPEFGPDGYLQCEPYSGKPVADLWEINTWIGQRQRERAVNREP